ncbi:6229_t:CDS:2 [Rhizophagus irregularis]|nr:6229_t:CDS:2 [Rhizophagus irregularis]
MSILYQIYPLTDTILGLSLPWDYLGITLGLPWDYLGITLELPWNYLGTYLWDYHYLYPGITTYITYITYTVIVFQKSL